MVTHYSSDMSLAIGLTTTATLARVGSGSSLYKLACTSSSGIGEALIPSHSALASFFQLSVSTTLTLHMLSAYTLFTLVLIHAFLYVSWVALINNLSANARKVLPVLNPTYLYHETWPGNGTSLGVWRASLIFTGLLAAVIMLIIFVTTLPKIRRKHFNLFYFTHLSSIFVVIIICLHASTMLYCTAPGLAMWCLDWSMRLHELKSVLYGEISTFGNGWYCITVPIPRSRLAGCSCRSPLAHFFIHHGDSSSREVHPFTTITHLATKDATTPSNNDDIVIQFLFRKVTTSTSYSEETPRGSWLLALRSKLYRRPRKTVQWTEKVASSFDEGVNERRHRSTKIQGDERNLNTSIDIALRLEGPYFSPADPSRYHTVVCLVAGTGISGALAIAGAFSALQNSRTTAKSKLSSSIPHESPWRRCVIVWSVREMDFVELPPWDSHTNVEIQILLTGPGRPRPDLPAIMAKISQVTPPGAMIWTYISGPKGFLENAKTVCKAVSNIEYHAASWDI
ncbi:MAG: hypothetical protein Q9182_002092 [Xanthomendoza sp. 2 TL-2023]